ncbi:MAG: helix-turn-helix transcriptional regulator [Pseudomonadota bacterium]
MKPTDAPTGGCTGAALKRQTDGRCPVPSAKSEPFPFFGKRLKRQRVAAGLKQDALATAIGINQTTVSRWEQGMQLPDWETQVRVFEELANLRADDAALKRLVENTRDCVHLVDEASHVCLAYSMSRAEDWRANQRELLGVSLWQFATDEIREAERELNETGWWDELMPQPKSFKTSGRSYPEINISAGGIMWERIYLSDGTPARLVTGI